MCYISTPALCSKSAAKESRNQVSPRASAAEAKAPAKRKRSPMSNEHKQALAEGREQGRGVRLYLEALEKNRPAWGGS